MTKSASWSDGRTVMTEIASWLESQTIMMEIAGWTEITEGSDRKPEC